MALAQTDLPELKRFNFFVSRRFEEGRERFRLHMGYFATLAEAEEWLNVVREIYPGAWAGEAPGRKLRERAAAAQAAQAQHAAGPQVSAPRPTRAPLPVTPPAPAPEPEVPPGMSPLDAALSMRVPVLKAAAPATPAARPAAKSVAAPAAAAPAAALRKPAPAAAAPVAARKAAPAAPAAKVATPAAAPARVAAPAAAARMTQAPLAAPARGVGAALTAPAAAAAKPQPAAAAPLRSAVEETVAKGKGVFGDSNVREVLKALGDASATGETRLMRAPLPPPAPKAAAAPPKSSLSDTQVLKLLEERRPQGAEAPVADLAHGAIPLLKPDDTGTREALKDAVTQDAPVLFAVQLQWSVQPVELDKVPPLAIFSAYTLYTVEGSRDSRKWFGLRLGFFSDAISAKQVAHYVRSEFASVAVVPVSAQEKARATDQDKQAATLNGPVAQPEQRVDEFKLIDDDTAQTEVAKLRAANAVPAVTPAAARPAPARPGVTDAAGRALPGRPVPKVAVGRAVTQATAPAAAPAAARAKARPAGRVGAGEKRGAQSLEETLEILGASQLSIDNGNGETLNESGVRHLRVEVQKNSPFSKLLERLSERMKKP